MNVNEVNVDEVNVDDVNVDDMNEVNVNEEALEVSTVNKVNKESTEIKEEMSKGKSLEVMRRGSFAAKSEVQTNWDPGESGAGKFEEVKSNVNAEAKVEVSGAVNSSCVVKGKPPEVPQRFDFADKVQMEEFGMKEVKNFEDEEVEKRLPLSKEVTQIDDMKMKEESLRADWDPGERVDAKAQTEMFNVKEEKILVNNGKVELSCNVNLKAFNYAMALNDVVLFNAKAMLIVLLLQKERFVSRFRPDCPVQLSDYG